METLSPPAEKITPADPAIQRQIDRLEKEVGWRRVACPGFSFIAADFTETWHKRQLELIEAVLADPSRGVPLAEAAGVHRQHFIDDFLIVWTCIDVGRDLERHVLHRLIRHELSAEGYWDKTQVPANYGRPQWCDATLGIAFGAMFYSAMYIRVTADALAEHHRRWTEAEIHFQYTVKILEAA